MPRGRRSTWKSGKTKSVKLPELFLEELLEIAKLWDNDNYSSDKLIALSDRVKEKKGGLEELLNGHRSCTESAPRSGPLRERQIESIAAVPDPVARSPEQPQKVDVSQFPLTPDQEQALETLKQFVETTSQKYFRLTGYAGTGKSYLTVQLMKWLRSQKIGFVAGSPTNKAVKNLKKLAAQANLIIDAHTVAQLLGQQPVLNEETGKEEFVSKKGKKSIDNYPVVLIDEFSMLNKANFQEINEAVGNSSTKLIFVGDAAQLPPVGESEPIVATYQYIDREAALSSVVRYDGDIGKVAEEIRSNSNYNKFLYPFESTKDGTITCLNRKEWLERAIDKFKSKEYQANPDHVRLLVWRNKTAASLNNYVRQELWGENAPNYVPGDRLIAKIPVFRPVAGGKGKNKWQIIINNSEECEVVEEATLCTSSINNWEYWQVPVVTDNGFKFKLQILTPESEKEREKYLQTLKELKQWRTYYDTLKSFDNVPYAYAITTHKAQGSSIDYIFPDIADMRYCPDLQKMLYTALSRARSQAFIPF